MHCNAAKLFTDYFTLAGVDASANCYTDLLDGFSNRAGATHSSRRPVKARQEAIAGRINLATAIAFKLLPNQEVVMVKKLFPCPITDLGGPLSRTHDVGEQHRGKDAIRSRPTACAREERLSIIAE